MLRGLYRVYLYIVFIAMLFFAVYGVQGLLQVLLEQTPLRGSYDPPPSHTSLVQAAVLAAIALITAALIGGLHYWLIRRDMRSDASVGSGGIRAFFLNFVEAINLPVAVGLGANSISTLGLQSSYNSTGTTAYAITTLAAVAFLEWERRRTQAAPGAPIIFQRLHLYGVQLILLFILTSSWLSTVGQLVDSLFFGGQGTHTTPCGGFTACPGPNLLSIALSTLTIALFWLGYSILSRNDTPSLLRRVLQFIGLGYGIIFVLIGIYHALQLLLMALLKLPVNIHDYSGPFAQYDVVSPLSLGLLVVGVYTLWLRSAARRQTKTEEATVSLIGQAIAAALLGAYFWYGCGLLILDLLEKAAPSLTTLKVEDWTNAIALLITGLAYIPLDIFLRRRSAKLGLPAPLRGFVFALFGAGILAGAIGGATSLYAYGTSLLGSPFDNWQYTAHAGLAAFAVGVAIVGVYLWTAIHERFFGTTSKQPAALTPSQVTEEGPTPAEAPSKTPLVAVALETHSELPAVSAPSPIAETLDALLAGKITRDEAVARIEGLMKQLSMAPPGQP